MATESHVCNALHLGLGVGWRPELALLIERREDLGFVEVIAENVFPPAHIPLPIRRLRERGIAVIPHGVGLSLGGAERLQVDRLRALARLAEELDAPLVSEHLAFVRAAGMESGHLLPVPRTREALGVVVRNVREAQAALPVPLALENIASVFEWPDAEMTEADFLAEVLDQTGALLLLDVENLFAQSLNHGVDPHAFLERLPLSQLAYAHVAGGIQKADGFYHDTHAHAVPDAVFALLADLCRRYTPPGVMIERDDDYPPDAALHAELDAVSRLLHAAGSPVTSCVAG